MLELYDVHALLRPVRLKHLPAPWLIDDIAKIINGKNQAKDSYKVDASETNKTKYVNIRNRYNTKIRDAQRCHIHKSVENGDPSILWRYHHHSCKFL